MTSANEYIVLQNSNATLTKYFRVAQSGYHPVIEKAQNVNKTIGGIDVATGSLYHIHQYVLFLREEEESSGSSYGTLDDIKTFYSYNNPSGTPSNIIAFTDHFGNSHSVYMLGQFGEEPLTTILAGQHAWYLVPIVLQFIPEVQL